MAAGDAPPTAESKREESIRLLTEAGYVPLHPGSADPDTAYMYIRHPLDGGVTDFVHLSYSTFSAFASRFLYGEGEDPGVPDERDHVTDDESIVVTVACGWPRG